MTIIIADPRVLTQIRSPSADCLQDVSTSNKRPQPILFEISPPSDLFAFLSERSKQAPRDGTALATRERQSRAPSRFCHWNNLNGNIFHSIVEGKRWRPDCFSFPLCLSLLFSHFLSIRVFPFLLLLLSALNALQWQAIAKCSLINDCKGCFIARGSCWPGRLMDLRRCSPGSGEYTYS